MKSRSDPWLDARSAAPGIAWPALPAYPGALMLSVQHQLERSQWWSPEEMLEAQLVQLRALLRHARDTVPFYRERLADLPLGDGERFDLEAFRELPLLERTEVQVAGDSLNSRSIPAGHGDTAIQQTTGSSGHPLQVLGTRMSGFFGNAMVLRDHLWHGRDLRGKLACIQSNAVDIERESWGPAVDGVFRSGALVATNVERGVPEQAAWLAAQAPDYLLTYVTNGHALASHCLAHGIEIPSLRELRTTGEVMRPDLPDLARAAWNATVVDAYSAQEAGTLALQCPETGDYHVQSEVVLFEVLDDAGRPVGPGETGRVVLTPLHNFATPLVRYAILDFAEIGPPCACGRGLPVLKRIHGRERNMITLPDGSRHWPSFPARLWLPYPYIRQVQLRQRDRARIEVRVVADRRLDEAQESALTGVLRERLGHPFELTFTYVETIERAGGYKYEDFISEICG